MPDGFSVAGAGDPLIEAAIEPARELLGGLIIRPAGIHDLLFNPLALPTDLDREIFDAIAARADLPGPIGPQIMAAVALDDPLRARHITEAISGHNGASPNVLRDRADHLTALWQRRRLLECGSYLKAAALRPIDGEPTESIIAEAEIALDEIKAAHPVQDVERVDVALDGALAGIDRAARGEAAGISTGFRSLDRRVYRLEPGAMIVAAGRPGMGKTAFGQAIAMSAAQSGTPTLIFSLEMTRHQLLRRALAAAAGVSLARLRSGDIGQVEADRIAKAAAAIRPRPLFIDDKGGVTLPQIAARARVMKRRYGIGLVLIDYLHLIRPDADSARMGATWAIGKISNGLKALAKELEVPVIALAQLNRSVEGREDHRPSLADLRQSGEIEQDADAVLLLHRPGYYLERSRPTMREGEGDAGFEARVSAWQTACDRAAGVAEVIVAKLRDGEPGTVNLRWNGALARFEDPEE